MRLAVVAFVVLAAGCAGGPPEWIESPEVEGGFAATECVKDSGKLSIDRQVAVAKAREGLARQLAQRAAALDRAWAARGGTGQGAFANAALGVAAASLADLAPSRVEYVEVDDTRNLCAMVTVEPDAMQPLFDKLVLASGETPDEAAKKALFEEFSGESGG